MHAEQASNSLLLISTRHACIFFFLDLFGLWGGNTLGGREERGEMRGGVEIENEAGGG